MQVRRGIGFGRNNLPGSRRPRTTRLSDGEVLNGQRFFVPAFGVRRQLYPDEVAQEFCESLEKFCEKKPYTAYPINKMGITVLGKNKIVDAFLRADVQPAAYDMLDLALNVRDALGAAVKSKPHLLKVPLGGVAVFGADNKIAATIEGWKGFDKRYASRDEDRSVLANSQLVREINSAVGEVVQFVEGGTDSEGEYVEVSTRAIQRQSPHFTFAAKNRGTISNSERADISGQVAEFMPPELRFFDPVVNLGLVTPGSPTVGITNNPSELTIDHEGVYVRRPKLREFGGATLQACISGYEVA